MADPPSFEALRNVAIVLFVITVLVTSYRCHARFRKRLWWHDDSVALFSALSFVVFLTGSVYLAKEIPTSWVRTRGTYMLAVGFYVPIWGARISIVLTMVRITPWRLQRKILIWIAVFFFLQFAMLTAQMFWVCELTHTEWKQIPGAICLVPPVVPISLVVTTIVSDITLVVSPLMIARGVHIQALRFRLFSIFSMSIATTVASLVHAILILVNPGIWEAIFGGVESAVAIIVSNMSVIIPAILRALGVGDPFMQEDTVDPRFSTGVDIAPATSTTIELAFPTCTGTDTTAGSKSRGEVTVVVSHRASDDLDTKDGCDHRLAMQASDCLRGSPKSMKIEPPADGSDVPDPSAQTKSLPRGHEGL